MNFLLPRIVLLLVMLITSVWALLDRPGALAAESGAACATDATEVTAVDANGRRDIDLGREIRWQSFLPGTLR
jgi:hypothetical protein